MNTRPPFNAFPILESDKIRMRRLVVSDAEHTLEVSYFNRIRAKDVQEAGEMIVRIEERYVQGIHVHWGIEDKRTGEIVGTCGFYRGFTDDAGEVGYVMKEKFRRKGYMSEAVRLVTTFGFERMKLKRVFATTAPDNTASHGVLKKNGFVEDGVVENGDLKFTLLPAFLNNRRR